MNMNRVKTVAIIGFMLFTVGNTSSAGLIAAQSSHIKMATVSAQNQAPHIACASLIRKIAETKESAMDEVKRNDIAGLTRTHSDIQVQLTELRSQMDAALLTGAWSNADIKKSGFGLIGRLEGVRILNLINVAFLKGYKYPTNTVPASVADATNKFYSQLAIMLDQVDGLNKKIGERGAT